MVQFIFKHSATGSTITLNATETVNQMESAISRMFVAKAKLSQRGQVDAESIEAVAECKGIFQEKISQEVVEILGSLSSGWKFENMTFPEYKEED